MALPSAGMHLPISTKWKVELLPEM